MSTRTRRTRKTRIIKATKEKKEESRKFVSKMIYLYSRESALSLKIKESIKNSNVILSSVDNKIMRKFLSKLLLSTGKEDIKITVIPSLIVKYTDNTYEIVTEEKLLKLIAI